MRDLQIHKVIYTLGRRLAGGAITPLGTCFAVTNRRFATAAHVVGPSDENLVAIIPRFGSFGDYQDTTDQNVSAIVLKMVVYSPFNDIAILEFSDSSSEMRFGYSLAGTDMLLPGTPVISLGYPHADHGRLVLTQQSSMVGARVILGANGLKFKHAVLNTQTRPGQSGGPVFTSDGKYICAMVTGGYSPSGAGGSISLGGIDPQTLHQTTHAVSAEYIKELL